MAGYTSAWWRYRHDRIQDLVNTSLIRSPQDSLDQNDLELLHEGDNAILHERHTIEDGEHPAIPPTQQRPNPISAAKIDFVPLLPEYPSTHPDGYAYVVNLRHMTADEKEHALDTVQYAHKRDYTPDNVFCSFLGCYTTKRSSTCSGIKHCEYLDDYLHCMSHTSVDEDLISRIFQFRKGHQLDLQHYGKRQRSTTALYQASIAHFRDQSSCQNFITAGDTDHTEGCQLQYGKYPVPTVSGIHHAYLRCKNSNTGDPGEHFHYTLAGRQASLDLPLLQYLVEKGLPEDRPESCYKIYQTSTRAKQCDVVHPQGPGKIIRPWIRCKVQIRTFRPYDLEKHPYVSGEIGGVYGRIPKD